MAASFTNMWRLNKAICRVHSGENPQFSFHWSKVGKQWDIQPVWAWLIIQTTLDFSSMLMLVLGKLEWPSSQIRPFSMQFPCQSPVYRHPLRCKDPRNYWGTGARFLSAWHLQNSNTEFLASHPKTVLQVTFNSGFKATSFRSIASHSSLLHSNLKFARSWLEGP